MRFFIYGFKANRLFTAYREGSHTGPLINLLRAEGWEVFWRRAKA